MEFRCILPTEIGVTDFEERYMISEVSGIAEMLGILSLGDFTRLYMKMLFHWVSGMPLIRSVPWRDREILVVSMILFAFDFDYILIITPKNSRIPYEQRLADEEICMSKHDMFLYM